jgi:hypothetical protein
MAAPVVPLRKPLREKVFDLDIVSLLVVHLLRQRKSILSHAALGLLAVTPDGSFRTHKS